MDHIPYSLYRRFSTDHFERSHRTSCLPDCFYNVLLFFQEEMDASIDMDPAALSLFFLFHASFQEGHHKDRAFLPVVLPTRIASQSFQRPAQETPQVFPRTEVQCILAVLLFFPSKQRFPELCSKISDIPRYIKSF